MGSQDDSTERRPLRLHRETVRDLTPSHADAATVLGGDTSTCGGKEFCLPKMSDVETLLGRTAMSWGCTGSVRFKQIDDGFEIVFDLHPNQEVLDAQERLFRSSGRER